MAKLLATEMMEKVATECLQFFGGYGFMEEYPLARMYRDVRVGTIGGGSSEIMREIIAKIVIDDVAYKKPEVEKSGIVERGSTTEATVREEAPSFASMLVDIQAKAANAPALNKTLKFDFGDQQLYIDGAGDSNQVSEGNEDADCTIQVSQEDFIRLVKGELNPMGAVMSGKIKIDGDMSVAMKLQTLFS